MGVHDTDRRCFKIAAFRTRKYFAGLMLVVFALVASATCNVAQAQTLSAQKWLCAGLPGTPNPQSCTHVGTIPANTPAFYVFQVTSLPGSPQQTVTISEINGPGFSPAWPIGFVVTAINCNIPSTSTATSIIFVLQPTTTATCTAAGYFTTTGAAPNTAHVSSGQGSIPNIFWNTNVTTSMALGENISINKSASTNFVTAPGSVNYTVTITNNGPGAQNIAPYFTFHDTLALLPNSVPLYATLQNWSCTGSPCLAPSPSSVNSPLLVGTSAPHPFFDWSFGSSTAVLAANTSIVLHYTVLFSAIPGLNCKKQPGFPDGLSNTGFFTLTGANSAAYDSNSADNTSTANVTVDTGATIVNPNCGDGQLSLKKIQTSPATSPVAWGTPVDYDLIIQNTSIPAQPTRIPAGDIRDLVTEGVNTPPFSRRFIGVTCASNQPGICNQIVPGNGTPPFQYSYYGQTDQGWGSGPLSPPPFVILNYNRTITLHITFIYENPDCDAVPLANPKPIDNTLSVDYLAHALGAPLSSPLVQMHQSASVTTYMEPPETCKFKVTKKLVSGGPNVHFGSATPLVYNVTFTNNDAPRTIGTIADMLRITDINYASPLTFTGNVTCTQAGGVVGYSGGPVSGQTIYTGTPAQGAIVFTQPPLIIQPPVFFPTNSTLSCQIVITLTRPPYGSPNCSSIPTDLENAGIMDPTRPYNPNGFWPPSGTYNPANTINPQSQDKDWATVRTPLPKCFDLVINKSASVAGVSPAWTYAGPGAPPIDYTITATNPTNYPLTGLFNPTTASGLALTDTMGPPPYVASPVSPPCTGMGCAQVLSNPVTQVIGITSLGAQASGDWHLTVNGPFIAGQSVDNCAHVKILGDYANPNDWYSNFDPSLPPPNAQTSCVSVPVLDVRPLRVLKRVVNNTGGTVYFAFPQSFAVQVSCAPYSIPTSQSSGTITMPGGAPIPNGGSAMGGPWTSNYVPVGDQCTVSETPPAVPVLTKQPCPMGNVLQWQTTYSPAQPITISAAAANLVTVVNTLYCQHVPSSNLTLIKVFQNATPAAVGFTAGFPLQTFGADANCNGQPLTNVSLTTPATTNTTTTSSSPATLVFSGLPVGTQCSVQENPNPPPMPAIAYKICRAHNYGLPVWNVSITPSQPFTLANGNNVVTIKNTVSCQPFPRAPVTVTKVFQDQTGSNLAIGPLSFPVQVLCTGAPTSNITLQTPATTTTSTSGQAVIPNVLVGGACIASETPSTAGLAQYCTVNGLVGTPIWQTTFTPGSSIQVQASGNAMTITNTLTCQPVLQKDNLNLIKTFTNQTLDQSMQFGPLTFNIQINCSDGQSFAAPVTTPQTSTTSSSPGGVPVTSALYGTTCTFSEPSQVIPSNAALACRDPATGVQEIPTWQVTFTPTVTTMVPGGVTEQVDNVLICVPGPIPRSSGNNTPAAGVARPQAGSSTQSADPSVPQCETTSVNGETKTTCTCPKGMKLKGDRCTKKKSALEDILGHVTIGVGVGVGGGSHGTKPKTEKPPVNGEDGR